MKAEGCNTALQPQCTPKREGSALASGKEKNISKTSFLLNQVRAEETQGPTPGDGRPDNRRVFGVQTFPFQSMDTGALCTPVTEARSLEGAMISLKPGVLYMGNPDSGQGRAE